MGREHGEETARTHTHSHTRTQQLSLVFQGRTDPTRTPWVFGSRAKGERERRSVCVCGGGDTLMQMTEGEERKEGSSARFVFLSPCPAIVTFSHRTCQYFTQSTPRLL